MKNLTHRFAAGLLAGSLVLAGVGSVAAAGNGQKAATVRALAYGQVSNVLSGSFTLTPMAPKVRKGQTTAPPAAVTPIAVTTTATTKERALKGTIGALANGEYALVLGAKTTAGLTASRVIYSAKPFRAGTIARAIRAHLPLRAAGTVTSSDSKSLTIQNKAGKSLSFTITDKTRFRVNGQVSTTAPTFTVGEKVRVIYTRDRQVNTLVARAIAVRTAATSQS